MERLVILAPNWLGDAVMALPAIADVRRAAPRAHIAVAAKGSIAPLFQIVADVNDVISVDGLNTGFDTALLLPNSFRSALVVKQAGIAERWGYRTQWRRPLLTRAIAPRAGVHQAEYYQQLVRALGFPSGPIEPRLSVPPAAREHGARIARDAGWNGKAPLVALAPGAAYGGAKRWPPSYFAELAGALASDGVDCVMVGTSADAATAAEVAEAFPARGGDTESGALRNAVGQTDLPALAGLLANCRALVTNDSGAMHLAAAIGVPVTAVFGPTNDRATHPLGDRACRADASGLVPAVHAARMPARSSVHARRPAGGCRGGRAKAFVTSGPKRPAVFLDRDGVLIKEAGYLDSIERLAFFPWTVDAVRALNRAGLPVVVITNQSGVARGFFSEPFVDEVHRHVSARLEAGGARIDAYYYCPHHPDGIVEGARPAMRLPQAGARTDRPRGEGSARRSRPFVRRRRQMDRPRARASRRRARDSGADRTRRDGSAAAAGRRESRCRRRQPGRRRELDTGNLKSEKSESEKSEI